MCDTEIACTIKNEELKVKKNSWYHKIFYGKMGFYKLFSKKVFLQAFSGKKGFLQAYDKIPILDKKTR